MRDIIEDTLREIEEMTTSPGGEQHDRLHHVERVRQLLREHDYEAALDMARQLYDRFPDDVTIGVLVGQLVTPSGSSDATRAARPSKRSG